MRMSHALPSLISALLLVLLTGCTALKGKTAGETLDDATITAAVKTKLAEEKLATLTRIGVTTNLGTVYLAGNVQSEAMRERAAELARQARGVREVVNNLKIASD